MIGPFFTGQVPAEPLAITVNNDDGSPRDLTAYTTITLQLYAPDGTTIDTSGGTVDAVSVSTPSLVVYHWPSTSLFVDEGAYQYQLALDGPGSVHDLTGLGTFEVGVAGEVSLMPTVAELASFWGDEAPTSDDGWDGRASDVLRQSADLLYLVTGMVELPEDDPRAGRLVRYAIMDMAILMYVGDPSEAYSPYSSERIGSYSYQLKQKAQSGETGSFWWDAVVKAIKEGEWQAAYTLAIETDHVFHRGFWRWRSGERLLHEAPLVSVPGAFEASLIIDPSSGADRWQPYGSTSDGSWAGDPYAWPPGVV